MNVQPIEKRDRRTDGMLAVHSIFLTIQGEGPFCGTPCVFVRLAGCNLQCPACDTDYTSTRRQMSPYEVLAEVNDLWRKDGKHRRGLVVVTGGEPFRQELAPLFAALTSTGYSVQVETNGTLEPTPWDYRPFVYHGLSMTTDEPGVYVVCSPKTPKLHPTIYDVACALKYVVRFEHVADDGLPTSALDQPNPPARPPEGWNRPVYVQPLDSGDVVSNDLNTAEAVSSCMEHGYTLQLQIHKLIGVE